jgi:hypothetical protein
LQQTNFPQQPAFPPQNSQQPQTNETSLEDLISGASKQVEEIGITPASSEIPTPGEIPADKPAGLSSGKPVTELVEEKKDKKDKSKASHLVYSDPDTSPEEKMARMSRYAFTPEKAR